MQKTFLANKRYCTPFVECGSSEEAPKNEAFPYPTYAHMGHHVFFHLFEAGTENKWPNALMCSTGFAAGID